MKVSNTFFWNKNDLSNVAIIKKKKTEKMYLTLYLFVPDQVLDLVPEERYKVLISTLYQGVLKSTLYLGAGTRYSKVPCTYQPV